MIAALLAAVLALLPLPAPAAQVAAHRGEAGVHENTLRSISTALSSGAAYVETDVRPTANPTVFVMLHDATLGRTTNCTGPVSQWMPTRLARRCRTNGGARVPSLSTYLQRVASTPDLRLLLELKAPMTPWQVRTIIRRLSRFAVAGRTTLQTFDLSLLRVAKHATRRIPVLYLTVDPSGPSAKEAIETGADGLLARYDSLDPQLVDALRGQSLIVGAWTPDDPAIWSALEDVDLIVTNRPRAAAAALGRVP